MSTYEALQREDYDYNKDIYYSAKGIMLNLNLKRVYIDSLFYYTRR